MDRIQKHITFHSSLLFLYPPIFTLNPSPSILHSASFNFQPYLHQRSEFDIEETLLVSINIVWPQQQKWNRWTDPPTFLGFNIQINSSVVLLMSIHKFINCSLKYKKTLDPLEVQSSMFSQICISTQYNSWFDLCCSCQVESCKVHGKVNKQVSIFDR